MRVFSSWRAWCFGLQVVACASERDGAGLEDETLSPEAAAATSAGVRLTLDAAEARASASASASGTASGTPSGTASAAALESPREPAEKQREASPWPSPERLDIGFPKPLPGARIYSKSRHLWIRSQPGPGPSDWLGYLSLGDSVRVLGGDALKARRGVGDGASCIDWYAVEPRGFVCTGSEGTLDANDPEVVELMRGRANSESAWPYRYGESLGTTVAFSLPGGAGAPGVPPLFALGFGGRSMTHAIAPRSTVAYTDAFQHQGQDYLLTWDRGLVKSERVRPYEESPFHGVALGGAYNLPLAFVKDDGGGDELGRTDDGRFEPLAQKLERLEVLQLTGKTEKNKNELLHETTGHTWVRDTQVGIARAATALPGLIPSAGGRKTWLDISIINGTLVAYEGHTPVYATLISAGRGGLPVPGIAPLKTASTPTGLYAVLSKFTTATMVSSTISTFVHSEVQYPQNFDGPYSLHAAYWHDRWGQRKSAGCVNLAPVDARRLFAWTDPPLPEGWHGTKSGVASDPRTLVAIHR